jgi:hypothetical protein
MRTERITSQIDFDRQTSRSHGRTGRTFVASAKVTKAELHELEHSARAEGKSLSEWSRDTLLREARRGSADAVFTELIATRMLLVNLLKPLALGEKVTAAWITEAMTMVRKEKHKAAQEVMQQYTQQAGKESSDGNTMG